MAVRPIVLYPDPVLLRPTGRVSEFDEDLRRLVEDLRDTMYAAPGIGLAANQIGESRRVCVVDVTAGDEEGHFHAFVNPEVVEVGGRDVAEEGCLSFPDIALDVERALEVTVHAQDVDGEPFEIHAEGLLARVLLHEIEHLDGQTFLRNVSSLKREMVKRQIKKRIKNGDWVAVVEA